MWLCVVCSVAVTALWFRLCGVCGFGLCPVCAVVSVWCVVCGVVLTFGLCLIDTVSRAYLSALYVPCCMSVQYSAHIVRYMVVCCTVIQ